MNRIRFSQEKTMNTMRFLDDWREKVDEWAGKNAEMIARYDALQNYRKMSDLAEDITHCEMHFFCNGGDHNGFDDRGGKTGSPSRAAGPHTRLR